ncbi:MAG: hypothetical protein EXS47_00600 [Candidatus Zambryskibacteria bacterium]|nr:hypothetical protein [Candidatus Zambryskibacteria bacterium]
MPFDKKAMAEHLAKIRPLAGRMKTKIRLDGLEKIRISIEEEVSSYPLKSKDFQKSLLAMLYWAEGSKHERISGLKFTNTDPKLIDLFASLLRNCYEINEARFRIYLQLHYYHPVKKTKQFWSNLLHIPEAQFNATTIKKRSRKKRFRKNFMGICSLCYLSSDIRKEILAIGYAIQKQIGNHDII